MEFNLGKYKIKSDERQYIVYKQDFVKESKLTKAENIGKEKWTPIAYFTSLENALKFVPQEVIRSNDDISIVMDKLEQIEAIIKGFTKE